MFLALLFLACFGTAAWIFVAAGSMDKPAPAQDTFAIYFYRNPFEVPAETRETPVEPQDSGSFQQSRAALFVGMPVVALGSFLAGLAIRRKQSATPVRSRKVEYVLLDPLKPRISKPTVSESLSAAKQQDTPDFEANRRANGRHCPRRFRKSTILSVREKQLR